MLLKLRSLLSPTCSDQCWSVLAFLFPQPNWLERGSAMAHSDLFGTDQSAQRWSVHSALSDTEWHWTELSYTSVEYSNGVFIIKKYIAHIKDWTLGYLEEVTWPKTCNIPLHHAALYCRGKLVRYTVERCRVTRTHVDTERGCGKDWDHTNMM